MQNQYTGIVWRGPVLTTGGYGNVSRYYLKSLEMLNIPIHLVQLGDDNRDELSEDTVNWIVNLNCDEEVLGERVLFIQHFIPDAYVDSSHYPNIVKSVGITIFETDRIPEHWLDKCELVDEIWVPTQFNMITFTNSGIPAEKLRLLPYGINTDEYYVGRPYSKYEFDEPVKTFKFLYASVFDFRKGYDLLIRSFSKAFSFEDDVVLVIKIYLTRYSKYNKDEVKQLLSSYIPSDLGKEPPQIVIIVESFTTEEVINLYQTCDAYISTDRANGWGMPPMEMMALGKPAITINWSGSTQYMNDENSFLINAENELEQVYDELQNDRPKYYKGHYWAKVKDEEVIATMLELYGNKEKRERIASNAAMDMRLNYSPEAIANQMKIIIGH